MARPRKKRPYMRKAVAPKEQPKSRGGILAAARAAVIGTRDVAYGSPENNFKRIERHLNAMLLNRFGESAPQLNRADVAMIGALFKVGRIEGNQQHLDSWVDIAGYAACGGEVA